MNVPHTDPELVTITLEVPRFIAESLRGRVYGYAVLCYVSDPFDVKPLYVVTTSDLTTRALSRVLMQAMDLPMIGNQFTQTFGVTVSSLSTGDGKDGGL